MHVHQDMAQSVKNVNFTTVDAIGDLRESNVVRLKTLGRQRVNYKRCL